MNPRIALGEIRQIAKQKQLDDGFFSDEKLQEFLYMEAEEGLTESENLYEQTDTDLKGALQKDSGVSYREITKKNLRCCLVYAIRTIFSQLDIYGEDRDFESLPIITVIDNHKFIESIFKWAEKLESNQGPRYFT